MSKREIALETIRIDVAQNGEVTTIGMRAYVENRVSFKAFKEAIAIGRRQFEALKRKEEKKHG